MENSAIDTTGAIETRARFTCDPAALESATSYLAKRIIERRNTFPILAYVRIAADPRGTVTLTGCNLDQEASVTLSAEVESPGMFCADAAILADMAKQARKDSACHAVTISDRCDGRAVIHAGRGRFNVPTLPADDFPVIELRNTLSAFFMPAAQFIGDLAALAPCMEAKGAKYYLHGVAMQARDMAGRDSLVLAATDGHQMGIASRPIPAGAGDMADCIIPSAAVAALVAARKLAPAGDTLSVESDGSRLRVDLGDVVLTTKLVYDTFPDWTRVWGDDGPLAPTDAQEALFPDLLPGAPVAMLEKLAKPFKGALAWSPTREGHLGTVAGDGGLIYAVMNAKDDGPGKNGFSYKSEHGEGEIIGPDGVTYPVAFSDKAIHLSAAQVRALCGLTVTFAVMIGGALKHFAQWCWDDGDSRLCTVQPDGKCFPMVKTPGQWEWLSAAEHFTRAEIEAALASEVCTPIEAIAEPAHIPAAGEPIAVASQSGAGDAIEPCATLDGGEVLDALSEAPSADLDYMGEVEAVAILSAEFPSYVFGIFATKLAAWLGGAIQSTVTIGQAGWPRAVEKMRENLEMFGPADHCEAPQAAPAPDPIAELVARIEALEARLQAPDATAPLSGESIATPTALARQRTPAHERAVRRAWAERKARRDADKHNRIGMGQLDAMRAERDKLQEACDTRESLNRTLRASVWNVSEKRKRAVLNARDLGKRAAMYRNAAEGWREKHRTSCEDAQRFRHNWEKASKAEAFERARAETLHAQLARIASETANYRERARAPLSRLMGGASPVALRAVG